MTYRKRCGNCAFFELEDLDGECLERLYAGDNDLRSVVEHGFCRFVHQSIQPHSKNPLDKIPQDSFCGSWQPEAWRDIEEVKS